MRLPSKKTASYVIVLVVIFTSVTACTKSVSPEAAWQKFHSERHVPEENLMDPLIVAGSAVVPIVLEKVRDKDTPRRRYAIGFLGNGAYQEAIPTLEHILMDETEKDFFRGDALAAMCQIDYAICVIYAEKYKSQNDYLGNIAKRVISGENFSANKRSYFAAWLAEL